ncbi:MAG: hypothetical protein U9P07_06350 [Pseudomonadota bacterium]|nr:hypothetical protein [Pseudomonadota bacterium]
MKSITIHGLDDPLDVLIREKARQQGMSLNKTIKKLLADSLGLAAGNFRDHRQDFSDLCGVWTAEDIEEFNRNIEDFRTIDRQDWR